MAELQVGDLVPDFSADSTKGLLSLEKLNNKIIVLYFIQATCYLDAQLKLKNLPLFMTNLKN